MIAVSSRIDGIRSEHIGRPSIHDLCLKGGCELPDVVKRDQRDQQAAKAFHICSARQPGHSRKPPRVLPQHLVSDGRDIETVIRERMPRQRVIQQGTARLAPEGEIGWMLHEPRSPRTVWQRRPCSGMFNWSTHLFPARAGLNRIAHSLELRARGQQIIHKSLRVGVLTLLIVCAKLITSRRTTVETKTGRHFRDDPSTSLVATSVYEAGVATQHEVHLP